MGGGVGQGRGWALSSDKATRHTFRAAAMSTLSSVSKGQISKKGWKSCNLSRHLGEKSQLIGSCPAGSPTSPSVSGYTYLSSSSRRCTAVLLVAGK